MSEQLRVEKRDGTVVAFDPDRIVSAVKKAAQATSEELSVPVDGRSFQSTGAGFFPTGVKPVYEIRTNEGYTLKATEDHPVLVATLTPKTRRVRWTKVGDLAPDDKLVLHNHRGSIWGGRGSWAEGCLLGYLLGNGTFANSSTACLDYWGESREQQKELAVTMIHAGVDCRSDLAGYNGAEKSRVTSNGLAELASSYGMGMGHKVITPEIHQTSFDFHCGFLRGLFDADGSMQGSQEKGVSIRLSQSNLDTLQQAQLMLVRLGIGSKIYEERRAAGERNLPDGHGGHRDYQCQANHELLISGDDMEIFANLIGFSKPDKEERLHNLLGEYQRKLNRQRFVARVKEVVPAGEVPVYDCQIPGINAFDANGLYVHNCGEIKLLSKQFCNLTMAIIRPEDSLETLKRKVYLAAILGTIQSSMTFFNYLSEDWKLNCEAERLLGVDIPGASDHPMLRHGAKDRNLWFEELKLVAFKANEEWAAKLGIQPSTAVTCSKPGGNSSVFLGVGHTVTGWNARYIKRHVRVNAIDPMARFLIDAGVPHWPEYDDLNPENPNVWVFAFPLKAPETAWINDGVGAVEMLENWLAFKRHWTEHNPSITVYVCPEEWIAVGNWVYEHWDEVGGLAFLPKDDHVYPMAPITPLSKEEFEAFETSFPKVPWEKFPRYEQAGDYAPDLSREYACTGDKCSIG